MNEQQMRRLQRMLRRMNDLSRRILELVESGSAGVVMATGPGAPPRKGWGGGGRAGVRGGHRVGKKMAAKRAGGGGRVVGTGRDVGDRGIGGAGRGVGAGGGVGGGQREGRAGNRAGAGARRDAGRWGAGR